MDGFSLNGEASLRKRTYCYVEEVAGPRHPSLKLRVIHHSFLAKVDETKRRHFAEVSIYMLTLPRQTAARWFFLVVSVLVIVLSWRIVEPFALMLMAAAIAAIML